MTIISIIAAVDEAGAIGMNNQLLAHLPADLKYFKSMTLGKPIIMGRKTYESIGKPLPGRTSIVVSSQLETADGVIVVSTLEQAVEMAKDVPEIMVIGGAQLYSAAMQHAARLYITKIHHQFKADTFFPLIDSSIWNCVQQTSLPHDEKNQYDMTFYIYERQ